MKEHPDSMPEFAAAPEPRLKLVSIYVSDDHPLLKLKRALDWGAIREVMIKHWRKAGKNVDGRPGLPWPTDL
jgi:hypothetical protein